MRLQFVVDMNLSPESSPYLTEAGWPAAHWSAIGSRSDDDATISAWAVANRHVDFTHDLDFGSMLAMTHANGPSVLQTRHRLVLPEHIGPSLVAVIRQNEQELLDGALIVVNESQTRVRVLPF